MRRERIDVGKICAIVRACVVSDDVLARISGITFEQNLVSEPAKSVLRWLVRYYVKYRKAPKTDLENIFYAYCLRKKKEDAESIGEFIRALGIDMNEIPNPSYILDLFSEYITQRKLEVLREDLDFALSEGKLNIATEAVSNFRNVTFGQGQGFDPLCDREPWNALFDSKDTDLIHFMDGPASSFLDIAFRRDSLIGIQGPEKSGKTAFCIDIMFQALLQRRKVALFEVGDLSEMQLLARLASRIERRPIFQKDCGKVRIPKSMVYIGNQDNEDAPSVSVEYATRNCLVPINKGDLFRARKSLVRACGIPKGRPYLMVSVHANSSINVKGINTILSIWESEKDYVPDIVIIDYADILAAEDPRQSKRDQVNETWQALRRLSQEKHCCVIVPTQCNRLGYEAKWQHMKYASEDKRKLAHVTAMLGLNQTEAEASMQVMRLNWIVLREASFEVSHCLHIGQCRTLGRSLTCAV